MTAYNNTNKQTMIGKSALLDEQEVEEIRLTLHQEGQELFSRSLRGGMLGVFLEEAYPFYFVSKQLLEEYKMSYGEFLHCFDHGFFSTIHESERASYQRDFLLAMQELRIFDRISKAQEHGHIHYIRDIAKKVILENGREIAFLLRSDVSELFEQQQQLKQKANSYEQRTQLLEEVTVSIPCAVCRVDVKEHFIITFGNDEFYKLSLYTEQQMKEERQNQIDTIIYEQDLADVRALILNTIQHKEREIQLENRIVRRDGTVIWLLVKGYFSYHKQDPELVCSFMDITNRKRMEEEAKISRERFRIALAVTDSTIFEYDIETKVMVHGDRSAVTYGLQHITENVPESLLEMGTVHPDDAAAFLTMYHQIQQGAKQASCLVKCNMMGTGYVWRKIAMTNIFDENGKAVQAIGVLEDVDEQVKREEALRFQTERDALTGLYNRRFMVERMQQHLNQKENSCLKAIMIIDIDDFKTVNDTKGHMFGDFVLTESSKRITERFQKDVYIGRIGGDEFFAFFTYLPSADDAQAYAKQLVNTFHEAFCYRGVELQVTCSVGYALFPEDGASFEVLYQNADLALYEAKRSGKNKGIGFDRSMEMPEGYIPYKDTKIEH